MSRLSLRDIVAAVSAEVGFRVDGNFGRCRTRARVQARWMAWSRAHALGYSANEIGRHFKMHHTTVLDGIRRYANMSTGTTEARRDAAGLCRRCGEAARAAGHTLCEPCLAIVREKGRLWRERRDTGRRVAPAEQEQFRRLRMIDDPDRPRTRGDCANGLRPCPYVSCRHHLYLEVNDTGTIKFNHPNVEVEDMAETCSLDVADRGGETLQAVGALLGLTRERVRQIEESALEKLKRRRREFEDPPDAAASPLAAAMGRSVAEVVLERHRAANRAYKQRRREKARKANQ